MVLIAHISDFHCGKGLFSEKKLAAAVREVNRLKPSAVIISGDLTNMGFRKEFELAKKYIDRLKPQTLIIPGNHDARFVGYKIYDEMFGKGNNVLKLPGIGIVGVDSTIPDLDEGNVGRGKTRWIVDQLNQIPDKDVKIVVLHHHLLPIPFTGRERSTATDAGDVLHELVNVGVDLVLSGHKHTPYAWFLNKMALVTAGSVSSKKLRADIENSYNIIDINSTHIDVFVKPIGGTKRPLARYQKRDSEEYKLCLP